MIGSVSTDACFSDGGCIDLRSIVGASRSKDRRFDRTLLEPSGGNRVKVDVCLMLTDWEAQLALCSVCYTPRGRTWSYD